jgi:FAD/FMN-containing dehydrogenase
VGRLSSARPPSVLDEHVPVLPRGAGSSQCGQRFGAALVIDHSKHLTRIGAFDRDAMTVSVEPGVVLDRSTRG